MTSLGRWTLVETIGRGAAGTVWRATDDSRVVTIKIADPHDAKAQRSLLHEGRILTRVRHPNLPRLIETFESPQALVLDVAPALTYGDLLAKGQLWTFPLRQRIDALLQIGAALDHLHQQGVIHRDIKPAHITATDTPLLFDFGVAQGAADTASPDPDAGTAAYMPPPGEPVSSTRDAYSFGITAYEMLFGAHPLLVASDRDIAPAVLRQRAAAKIRAGRWRQPSRVPHWELPPDLRGADLDLLDELFGEALGPPDSRPKTLSEWVKRLRAAIPRENLDIAVAPDVIPEAFIAAYTAQEVAASLRTDGGGRINWRALLVVLVAILTAIVLALLRR